MQQGYSWKLVKPRFWPLCAALSLSACEPTQKVVRLDAQQYFAQHDYVVAGALAPATSGLSVRVVRDVGSPQTLSSMPQVDLEPHEEGAFFVGLTCEALEGPFPLDRSDITKFVAFVGEPPMHDAARTKVATLPDDASVLVSSPFAAPLAENPGIEAQLRRELRLLVPMDIGLCELPSATPFLRFGSELGLHRLVPTPQGRTHINAKRVIWVDDERVLVATVLGAYVIRRGGLAEPDVFLIPPLLEEGGYFEFTGLALGPPTDDPREVLISGHYISGPMTTEGVLYRGWLTESGVRPDQTPVVPLVRYPGRQTPSQGRISSVEFGPDQHAYYVDSDLGIHRRERGATDFVPVHALDPVDPTRFDYGPILPTNDPAYRLVVGSLQSLHRLDAENNWISTLTPQPLVEAFDTIHWLTIFSNHRQGAFEVYAAGDEGFLKRLRGDPIVGINKDSWTDVLATMNNEAAPACLFDRTPGRRPFAYDIVSLTGGGRYLIGATSACAAFFVINLDAQCGSFVPYAEPRELFVDLGAGPLTLESVASRGNQLVGVTVAGELMHLTWDDAPTALSACPPKPGR